MYIWRVGKLVEEFKNGTLTEQEKVKYVISFCLFQATGLTVYSWVPLSYRILFINTFSYLSRVLPKAYAPKIAFMLEALFMAAPFLLTALGIWYCYRENKKGDDKNFVDRFVCLSVPIIKQIIVITILFYVLIIAGTYFIFSEQLDMFLNSLVPNIKGPVAPKTHIGLLVGLIKVIPQAIQIPGKIKAHWAYLTNVICYAYMLFSSTSIVTTIVYYIRVRSKIKIIAESKNENFAEKLEFFKTTGHLLKNTMKSLRIRRKR
ncbi:hypothetical protein HN446_01945 [bacterium]|jgi:hypothetical protein|nr:hypothetical protein [bacterium]